MNEVMTTVVSALGVIFAFLSIAWKMRTDIRNENEAMHHEHRQAIKIVSDDHANAIKKISQDHVEAIQRVYERFDEYKKRVEETHVSKEVFSLTYSALVKDIGEIKNDVKALLGQGKN